MAGEGGQGPDVPPLDIDVLDALGAELKGRGVEVKDDGTTSPWIAQPTRENISLRKPGGKG